MAEGFVQDVLIVVLRQDTISVVQITFQTDMIVVLHYVLLKWFFTFYLIVELINLLYFIRLCFKTVLILIILFAFMFTRGTY